MVACSQHCTKITFLGNIWIHKKSVITKCLVYCFLFSFDRSRWFLFHFFNVTHYLLCSTWVKMSCTVVMVTCGTGGSCCVNAVCGWRAVMVSWSSSYSGELGLDFHRKKTMSTETRHKITNKSCVQYCFVKHGLINSGRKTLNINLNGATVIFSINIFLSLCCTGNSGQPEPKVSENL